MWLGVLLLGIFAFTVAARVMSRRDAHAEEEKLEKLRDAQSDLQIAGVTCSRQEGGSRSPALIMSVNDLLQRDYEDGGT